MTLVIYRPHHFNSNFSLDGLRSSALENFVALTNLEQYLNIDTYFDDSDLNLKKGNAADRTLVKRIVKIKGVVVNKDHEPLSFSYNCGSAKLYAGTNPN